LRRSQAELRDFVENCALGLRWVGADGTILWANRAELDLLGYTREEYVGRHVGDFHADQDAVADILERLRRRERLSNREARLRCKDGSIRTVLISSNAYVERGEFVHTRCFTADITERKQVEILIAGQKRALELIAKGLRSRRYWRPWLAPTRSARGMARSPQSCCSTRVVSICATAPPQACPRATSGRSTASPSVRGPAPAGPRRTGANR
jgi:PAS domain S-box-containing protein